MPVAARSPILVTGAPRSGTTFLGTMLSLNRDVSYIYEPLSRTYGVRGIPVPMLYARTGSRDEAFAERAVTDLLAGRARFTATTNPADSPLRRRARAVLGSKPYLRYKRAALNPLRRRWLLKDPWAAFSAEWLHQRFAMATVVIVRHPAPTTLSYQRLGWNFPLKTVQDMDELMADHLEPVLGGVDAAALDDLESSALLWRIFYSILGTYVDRNPDMIVLRHEDLSADPVTVLRGLYQRLGLRFDDRACASVTKHTSAGNQGEAVGGQVHVLRRDSAAVATAWRAKADPAVVSRIRALVEPEASRWYSDADW